MARPASVAPTTTRESTPAVDVASPNSPSALKACQVARP